MSDTNKARLFTAKTTDGEIEPYKLVLSDDGTRAAVIYTDNRSGKVERTHIDPDSVRMQMGAWESYGNKVTSTPYRAAWFFAEVK
jgi:hypothetical protein